MTKNSSSLGYNYKMMLCFSPDSCYSSENNNLEIQTNVPFPIVQLSCIAFKLENNNSWQKNKRLSTD